MVNQSTAHQRKKIHDYFIEHGSATTIQIRHELDVMQPAARIFELRHNYGLNIQKVWADELNPNGTIHSVAKYILKPGKYKEGEK